MRKFEPRFILLASDGHCVFVCFTGHSHNKGYSLPFSVFYTNQESSTIMNLPKEVFEE